MELDELKQQLNLKISTAKQQRSAVDIGGLLKKDTLSVIQKIKRSLRIELILSIAFIAGSVFVVVADSAWSYKTYFSIFIFVAIAFALAIIILLKKINTLSNADNVRNNLQRLIAILNTYVKRYLQLGIALIPVCFAFAYWLSYNDPTKLSKPFRWDIFAYLTAGMIVLSTIAYNFSKWYLKKLYGNYINRLESLLKEIDET